MPCLLSSKSRESIPSVQLPIQSLFTTRGYPMNYSKHSNTSSPSFAETRQFIRSLKFNSVVQRAIREARDLYPTQWNLLYLPHHFNPKKGVANHPILLESPRCIGGSPSNSITSTSGVAPE